jgi:hypothetical protein
MRLRGSQALQTLVVAAVALGASPTIGAALRATPHTEMPKRAACGLRLLAVPKMVEKLRFS